MRPKPPAGPAPAHPVARVAVDLPLAHLDRAVRLPRARDVARAGGARLPGQGPVRRPRRRRLPDRPGRRHRSRRSRWRRLRRVVSASPCCSRGACRCRAQVADRYAGTLADVLRLAVPPRHARVEAEEPQARRDPSRPSRSTRWPRPGRRTPAARPSSRRLGEGESPRAVWTALPGRADWARRSAAAAAATSASGRGSSAAGPDARDVARLDAGAHGPARLGPPRRPDRRPRPGRALPRLPGGARGQVQIVVGTRAAAFAPVARPRPGRHLGRRRRPVRRAPGAVPARARGAAAAGAPAESAAVLLGRARPVGRGRRRWSRPAGPRR